MKIFGQFANFYDLIYSEKDTAAEADYIFKLIRENVSGAKSLLDLGCGTGRHSVLFGSNGLSVTGVDLSEEMLSRARERTDAKGLSGRVKFQAGDMRSLKLGEKFDVVACLFHVFSYLQSRSDCLTFLKNVRSHLNPGGVLLFDFWHAGAVLSELPQIRVKRVRTDDVQVTRIGEPKLDVSRSVVDLRYEFFVRDLKSNKTETFSELHSVRYFTISEVKALLEESGYQCVLEEEWLTRKPVSLKTFGALIAAR